MTPNCAKGVEAYRMQCRDGELCRRNCTFDDACRRETQREGIAYALRCLKSSTEYRIGNPAFEQAAAHLSRILGESS